MRIDKDKLHSVLADKGMFIKDLCRRIGISEYTLNREISGDADLGTASKIAHVLNVKVEELTKEGVADE